MYYEFNHEGKNVRVYNGGGREFQEKMQERGWWLVIRKSCNESPEELYARLVDKYEKVRIYWSGTMVRGIHNYFAFVK